MWIVSKTIRTYFYRTAKKGYITSLAPLNVAKIHFLLPGGKHTPPVRGITKKKRLREKEEKISGQRNCLKIKMTRSTSQSRKTPVEERKSRFFSMLFNLLTFSQQVKGTEVFYYAADWQCLAEVTTPSYKKLRWSVVVLLIHTV